MAEDWFIEEYYGMSREELEKDIEKREGSINLFGHKNCPCRMPSVEVKKLRIISSYFHLNLYGSFFTVIRMILVSDKQKGRTACHYYPIIPMTGLN